MNRSKPTAARASTTAPRSDFDRWTRRTVIGGLATLTAMLTAWPAAAVMPPAARGKAPVAMAQPLASPSTVTLITGDRVQLDAQGQVRSITPGPGRRSVVFTQTRSRGEVSVLPSDAVSLIQRNVVDPRLFNVSLLVKYGYDDAKRGTVPTIARGFDGGSASMRSAGMQTPRALGVLRGFSGAVDKRRASAFWNVIKQGGANAQRGERFGPRVWLDGQRQPLLDKSVPQIGGDVAWAAGYTGTGITVAVLDTGIDAAHPDFSGRIAVQQNFTTDADTQDFYGHGTHVASIIAGNGAASGGKYKGVAPNATLAIGKVCTQFGCADSDVIEGMQWAAETVHARVANLSLGGPGAPGIDPVEEALNTLSASTGTLFVVAAGNAGCPADGGSVGSPGSAEAALSVGAIDRAGQMASFSSCGPRQGDGAVKPEITGPGVNIVAARSSVSQFPPTDASGYYTTLSGTSMATPHVAGSAALLAQQHPTWTGADIKGMLIATADRSNAASLYSQGAGLVNIGAAVKRTWYDAAGNLSFGVQPWPHGDDAVLVKRLTLRNGGSQSVNLSLNPQAASITGVVAPPGMFYLSATQVSVPAGGSVNVDLMADTRVNVADGLYAGTVTISDGQADSTTLFSVSKEVESYDLALTHIDASGQPSTIYQSYVDGLDADNSLVAPASSDGKVTLRLPKGHYRVLTLFPTTPRVDVLTAPSVNLDRNLALSIDARSTAPWQITLPDTSMQPFVRLYEAVNWQTPFGMSAIQGYTFDSAQQLYFGRIEVPGAPRTQANFAFNAEAELGGIDADGQTDMSRPIVYVVESARGVVPVGLRKTYQQRELASIKNRLPSPAGSSVAYLGIRPSVVGGASTVAGFFGANALGAIEFQVNAGPYLRWFNELYWQSSQTYEALVLKSMPAMFAPGSETQLDWTAPRPFTTSLNSSEAIFDTDPTPDLVRGDPNARLAPGLRRGGTSGQDTIFYALQPFGDSVGHTGTVSAYTPNTVVVSLSRGGTLLYQVDASNYGSVKVNVPSDLATYTLSLAASTPATFIGTLGLPVKSTTDWTFQSGPASPDAWTTLPMSVVRLGKLARNVGGGWLIPLQVERQATGAPVPDTVQSLSVEVSSDGGNSWKAARLSGSGSQWTAAVPLTAFASRSLSVRTVAVSKDGAQVKQTVIGAYAAPAP